MAKRRRFSSEPFGPAIERLMDETGTTYRGLAAKTGLSAGYLNHLVHGNRPVPSNEVIERLAQRARRRAGALPRVPAARDHGAARGDARSRRPALPPPQRVAGRRRARRRTGGWRTRPTTRAARASPASRSRTRRHEAPNPAVERGRRCAGALRKNRKYSPQTTDSTP